MPPTHRKYLGLRETSQTWWQLSAIQIAGAASLPVIILGKQILARYGFPSMILALVLGNLILFGFGLGIVTMCDRQRKNTLENACHYLGRSCGPIIALTLILTMIGWFSIQLRIATTAIMESLHLSMQTDIGLAIQIGVGLAIIGTIGSLWGITGIKWITICAIPFIFFFLITAIVLSHPAPIEAASHSSTLRAVPLAMGIGLGITFDYPTFFRHSRSRKDSIITLLLILAIVPLIEIVGIYSNAGIVYGSESLMQGIGVINQPILTCLYILFIVVTCLGINSANLYSASIGWELLLPKLIGKKEFIILGLAATILFTLSPTEIYTEKVVDFGDVILVSLGVVLISSFVARKFLRIELNRLTKRLNIVAWITGSFMGILSLCHVVFPSSLPPVIGALFSFAAFSLVTISGKILKRLGWAI